MDSMRTREEDLAARREAAKRYRLAHPEIVKERKAAYQKTEQGRTNASAAGKRFRERHPGYDAVRQKAYYDTPRGRASAYLVKARSEIGGGCTSTLDEAEAFFRNKPELCTCCNKAPATCLDHKHSGPIRAWTCLPCNVHLGVIEKDGFLEIALKYLEKHACEVG